MTETRIKVLIAVGILAVVSLLYGILAPPQRGGRSRVSSSPGRGDAEAPPMTPVRPMSSAERSFRRGEHETWGSDPFLVKKASAGGAFGELVLDGIAWDAKNPTAIINDEVVTVGDKIEGSVVVAIEPMSVTLKQGEKKVKLGLDEALTNKEPQT